jgi:hypothetical protein
VARAAAPEKSRTTAVIAGNQSLLRIVASLSLSYWARYLYFFSMHGVNHQDY